MSLRWILQDNKILSSTLLPSTKNKCGLSKVGSIAMQGETKKTIKEALHVLKK